MSETSADDDCLPIRGPAHPCPYLPGKEATFIYARRFPDVEDGWDALLNRGYRRSGLYVYRTDCDGCRACVPLRVPVGTWMPDRSQRRALARNADVDLAIGRPVFDDEKAALFKRYLESRHDGQMSTAAVDIAEGLYRSPVQTLEISGRLEGRLVTVGIVDVSPRHWSLVYSAWDPDMSDRSLGTAYIGWAILLARDMNVPHVHLGYWIDGSRTMDYKARFRPYEIYVRGEGWIPEVPPPSTMRS